LTKNKFQLHQQTLEYPIIFYATKINFYATFTKLTQ